jgi:hypothetical protein
VRIFGPRSRSKLPAAGQARPALGGAVGVALWLNNTHITCRRTLVSAPKRSVCAYDRDRACRHICRTHHSDVCQTRTGCALVCLDLRQRLLESNCSDGNESRARSRLESPDLSPERRAPCERRAAASPLLLEKEKHTCCGIPPQTPRTPWLVLRRPQTARCQNSIMVVLARSRCTPGLLSPAVSHWLDRFRSAASPSTCSGPV